MPRLRRSDLTTPGITRRRHGRGFGYRSPDGGQISGADLDRVRGLVIPPAVCRSSYVDPRVIDRYDDGVTVAAALRRLGEDAGPGQLATQGAVERAVLRLLRA